MIEIMPKNHWLFQNARLLFTVRGCPLCRMYFEFIGLLNLNLPPEKKLEIIDCTKYHDYNIPEDDRIPIFMPYIQGYYPCLFFDSIKVSGANSKEELEASFRSLMSKDFILEDPLIVEDKYNLQFDKECQYEKKGIFWRRKLICR